MERVFHALVLNLHQPSGNLDELWDRDPWAAREVLFALDRIPRVLWGYEAEARVHLSLSGTLLETLASPAFQSKAYGAVDCGQLLWHLQNTAMLRILGTGYYHPVLPLTPEADRDDHLSRWLGQARHLFWRNDFPGFWPPEMGFCEELIPLLVRHGYRYVLVDNEYVEPLFPFDWASQRYRPYVASYGGYDITVIPRDRELSNAQLAGMDPGWFQQEVQARTRHADFPPLVTTASDGDNGGWFRNVQPGGNFWHVFYRPMLDAVRAGSTEIRPIFIEDFLARFGHAGPCRVHRGAWNTEDHQGWDFHQWTGSAEQKAGWQRVHAVSDNLRDTTAALQARHADSLPADLAATLEEARWHVLRAETSCHFYWGAAWVPRAHADLDLAEAALRTLHAHLRATVLPPPA